MAPIPKKPSPPKQQTLPKPQTKLPSTSKPSSPQKQPLSRQSSKVSSSAAAAAAAKRQDLPATSKRLPSPAPSRRQASPAPSKRLPSPAPSRRQVSPAPSKRLPSPAPSKRQPSPAPTKKTLPKKQPPPPLEPLQPAPPTICEPVEEASSPTSEALPGPALGAAVVDELARCLSTASTLSHGSGTTRDSRDSMGSETSANSRQSSGSFNTSQPASAASAAAAAAAPAAAPATSASSMLTPFPNLPGTQPATPLTPTSQQHLSKRRGYVRPQGTDFAASARQRESVLSLGSIAHLQHYFARTGLLDLKGQLERRRRRGGPNGKARTLDLSQLDPASYLNYGAPTNAHSSKKARPVSMLAVPTYILNDGESPLVSPPIAEEDVVAEGGEQPQEDEGDSDEGEDDGDWYGDEDGSEYDPAEMLPPTVSTYQSREKPVEKPPRMCELRADLKESLDNAVKVLADAREQGSRPPTATALSAAAKGHQHTPSGGSIAGLGTVAAWYEVQGMHILDVLTLAIRAAKLYYTGHEYPDRLDAIKPEREVRSELLGVMDVLRRMATRNFADGVRPEELTAMDDWIAGLHAMLEAEAELVAAERASRASWTWMHDEDWPVVPAGEMPAPADRARAFAREHAFMVSMLGDKAGDLPAWEPLDRTAAEAAMAAAAAAAAEESASVTPAMPSPKSDGGEAPPPDAPPPPTAFLHHMQTGVRLVELHNCAVRRSHRRFGAIPIFHANTQKPYRAADNLRFWGKAAELRWEVLLKIDALGIVYNTGPIIWADFEDALYHWCRKVREELASETDE